MGLWLIRLPRFLFFLCVLGFLLRLFLAEVDCDKRDVPDEYRQKQNRHHRRCRAHRDEHYLAEEIHERHVSQRTEGQRARIDGGRDIRKRYFHADEAQNACRAECGGRLSRIGRRGNNDNGERDEQGEREANGKGYEVALEFKQYLGNLGHIILVKNAGKKTVSREKLDDALYAQRLYDIRVIEICVRIDGDYIREICDGENCRREQRSHYPVESLHADRPFLLDYFFFLSHEELSATVRFMIRLPGVLSLSTQK